jgi:hypothetical protein
MKFGIALAFLSMSMTTLAQNYKDGISIVHFSADFISDKIPLDDFKKHNTFNFLIEKDKKIFDKEQIKYLPTIILYNNGDEIIRVEAGISLKLPDNTIQIISEHIDEILSNKF